MILDLDQIEQGRAVEREHQPTYDRLETYLRIHGRLPPPEWLFESIAYDHLDPSNPIEPGKVDYYETLKKAGL